MRVGSSPLVPSETKNLCNCRTALNRRALELAASPCADRWLR